MAELVGSHGEQVDSVTAPSLHYEALALVEVGVSAVDWEEGMRQGAAGTVESVTVTVITVLKPAGGGGTHISESDLKDQSRVSVLGLTKMLPYYYSRTSQNETIVFYFARGWIGVRLVGFCALCFGHVYLDHCVSFLTIRLSVRAQR